MKATTFPQANKILTAPPGKESEVYDLPVWSDGTRCISCWQPTEGERAAIARGEPVYLWVMGTTHPPVAIEVGSPFDINTWNCVCGEREIDFAAHPFACPACGKDVRGDTVGPSREVVDEALRQILVQTFLHYLPPRD